MLVPREIQEHLVAAVLSDATPTAPSTPWVSLKEDARFLNCPGVQSFLHRHCHPHSLTLTQGAFTFSCFGRGARSSTRIASTLPLYFVGHRASPTASRTITYTTSLPASLWMSHIATLVAQSLHPPLRLSLLLLGSASLRKMSMRRRKREHPRPRHSPHQWQLARPHRLNVHLLGRSHSRWPLNRQAAILT